MKILKRAATSSLLSLVLISGCSAASTQNSGIVPEATQSVEQPGDLVIPETEPGVLVSDADYQLFQSLKAEQEFAISYEYQQILRSSWQFARAALSDDQETMQNLAVPDFDVDVTMDIFDNDLQFLILKGVSQDGDSVWLNYEFSETGSDSFTYLTIEIVNTDDDYLVKSYAFEK